MRLKHVKLDYDPEVDAAYLTLGSGKIAGSEEVKSGLIIDYDDDDEIIGVEILRFSRRFKPKAPTPRTKNGRRKAEPALK